MSSSSRTPSMVLFVFAIGLLVAGCGQQKQDNSARIAYVYDADSYRMIAGGAEFEVRAIGVDAPEGTRTALDNQGRPSGGRAAEEEIEAGRLARERAMQLLPVNGEVRLAFDPANESIEHRDRYGRLLAFIYVTDAAGEEVFVNEKLIADGYARALTRFPYDEGIKRDLVEAERRARRSGAGLWSRYPRVFE